MALKRAAVTEEVIRTADVVSETQVISEEDKAAMAEARQGDNAAETSDGPTEAELKAEAEAKLKLAAEQKLADDAKLKAAESNDAADDAAAAEPEAQAREAATKPAVEAEPAKKHVAAVIEGGAVATVADKAAGAMAQFGAEMAAQGFEGMELTGMSFDRLKMHEGKFQLGSEEIDIGEVIYVQVMSTREIFVIRQHDGQKAEMFYSYDRHGKTNTDGTSAQETLDKWLEDGYGTPEEPLQIKTYIEGMAQLVDRDDEYNGHMVSLSIPPASKNKLAGAFAVGRQRFNAGPASLVIKCTVGKKIGQGDEAFRPWVFAAHRLMTADE